MRSGRREAEWDELEEEGATHCPLEWIWLKQCLAQPADQPAMHLLTVLHYDSLLAMSVRWSGVMGKDTCTPLFSLLACQD